MDVLVPPTARIDVSPGQHVTAGETLIGRLPVVSEGPSDDRNSVPAEAEG
jgi:hypothetical protein